MNLENNRYTYYLTWIVGILSLTLILGFGIFKIDDSDTIQYLANGKHIVQSGFSHDCVFNYSSDICQIPYSEWLFHVATYSIYQLGGWIGLNIFQILLVLGIFAVIAWHHRRKETSVIPTLAFFVIAIYIGMERFSLRADLLALGLSAIIYAISDLLTNRKNYILDKGFYLLAAGLLITQIIWANIHGSFPLGWGIIGAFAVAEILRNLWREKNLIRTFGDPKVKILLALTIGSMLVSLVNPFGLQAIIWPFKFFFGSSDFYSQLEFQSPFVPGNFARMSTWVFKWLIVISGITLLFNLKRMRWEHIFILATFLYLSINHIRYIPLYAIFCALILPQYLDNLIQKVRAYLDNRLSPRLDVISLLILLLLAYTIIDTDRKLYNKDFYLREGRSRETGFGFSELSFPVKAADFIETNNISGNMFNDYASGTYVNWRLFPSRQSFIDGHTYTLELLQYYKSIMSGSRDYREAVKKYEINYFLINYNSPDAISLVAKLYNDPDWSLVYYDDVGIVFLANKPQNQEFINQHTLKLNPEDKPDLITSGNVSISRSKLGYLFSSLNLIQIAAYEFDKAVQANPKNHIAITDLGAMQYKLGNIEAAYNNYQKSVELESHFAPTHFYLGIYHLEKNQLDESINEFRKTLKINHKYPLGNYYLGLAYETNGDKEKAEKHYLQELKVTGSDKAQAGLLRVNNDTNPESELHVKNGVELGQKGDHQGAINEFKKAIELSPGNYLAHFNLANAYLQTSQYQPAVDEYKRTLELQPTESDAIFNLGYIYRYHLSNTSQAKIYWEQYLRQFPTGSQATAAKEELNKINSGQ